MAFKKSKKNLATKKRVKKRGTRNAQKHKFKYARGHLPHTGDKSLKSPRKIWEHETRAITGINDKQIMIDEMQAIQERELELMENLRNAENKKEELGNIMLTMDQNGINKNMEKIVRAYKLVGNRCGELIDEIHKLRGEFELIRNEYQRRYMRN
jgi:hypothetical protein